MKYGLKQIRRFMISESGPTATEYAVMLALIVLVCVGAIIGIGQSVDGAFTNLDSNLPSGSGS